ncbi:MAG: Mini-ribonuclease 3 [Anaerovoracaceae bacterium]|jgi:ribonuclease-3 family protein
MSGKSYNTTVLAFMGDAIYEVYVRRKVIGTGQPAADKLHLMAVKYVKAESQAKAIKALYSSLSEEEQALARRARNRKTATKAKNTDPVTYKWATAFEALIGYLYLAGETGRMEEIIGLAMDAVDEKAVGK